MAIRFPVFFFKPSSLPETKTNVLAPVLKHPDWKLLRTYYKPTLINWSTNERAFQIGSKIMDLKKFSVLVSLAPQKILPEFFKLAISRTPWPISVLHWDCLSLVNSSQTKTKFYKFSSLQKQLCKSMERRSVWTLWVALPPQFTFKDFNFFFRWKKFV